MQELRYRVLLCYWLDTLVYYFGRNAISQFSPEPSEQRFWKFSCVIQFSCYLLDFSKKIQRTASDFQLLFLGILFMSWNFILINTFQLSYVLLDAILNIT